MPPCVLRRVEEVDPELDPPALRPHAALTPMPSHDTERASSLLKGDKGAADSLNETPSTDDGDRVVLRGWERHGDRVSS